MVAYPLIISMAKIAPEPRDIYWPNLSSKTADGNLFIQTAAWIKFLRNLFVIGSLFILVFSSTAGTFGFISSGLNNCWID